MSGPQAPASKATKALHTKSKTTPKNAPSRKRKAPADEDEDEDEEDDAPSTGPLANQSGNNNNNKKPKQKKTPTSKDTALDALLDLDNGVNTIFARMDPDLLADYVAAQTKRFGGDDLSSVELADLYIPAAAIRDTTTMSLSSSSSTRTKEHLAAFLEENVGGKEGEGEGDREKEKRRLGTAPKACGAPHTIVVTGAGLRAADLVRAARKFQKKDNVVAKLRFRDKFAKHFKVAEQVDFLKKNRTGIAVGTPARLMDLLDNGALSVEHLKRIVVDASHIDQKKRGLMDMKDTMMPLAKWLTRKEFKERYGDPEKPLELLFF